MVRLIENASIKSSKTTVNILGARILIVENEKFSMKKGGKCVGISSPNLICGMKSLKYKIGALTNH